MWGFVIINQIIILEDWLILNKGNKFWEIIRTQSFFFFPTSCPKPNDSKSRTSRWLTHDEWPEPLISVQNCCQPTFCQSNHRLIDEWCFRMSNVLWELKLSVSALISYLNLHQPCPHTLVCVCVWQMLESLTERSNAVEQGLFFTNWSQICVAPSSLWRINWRCELLPGDHSVTSPPAHELRTGGGQPPAGPCLSYLF